MARYNSLTNLIADMSSISQDLRSVDAHADWKMNHDGNLHLDVICSGGLISENFSTVIGRAAELCKQGGISMSLNFDQTRFGMPWEKLSDFFRRLNESHETMQQSIARLTELNDRRIEVLDRLLGNK